jgi:hypothetical protein
MDSQASVSSSTSTVPLDLIHDQDNDFVDEIDEVDRLTKLMMKANPVTEIDEFSIYFIKFDGKR